MSKSLKLKNNNYWDSTGIVHNKEKLDKVLENKQDKWQTIWEGYATTGDTISTGIDLTNIKGIRFAWSRNKNAINNMFEPDIEAFLNGVPCETSFTRLNWGSLVQWVDLSLSLSNKTNGTITILRGSYCYKYTSDSSFAWNNENYTSVTKVQIRY